MHLRGINAHGGEVRATTIGARETVFWRI